MCPMARSRRDIYNERLKVKNDVKMANLFTQARSTCLPRPGQPVYPGFDFFRGIETPSKTLIFNGFRHLGGPQVWDYHHQVRLENLV